MMRTGIAAAALAILGTTFIPADAAPQKALPPATEQARLARSAAPPHLRAHAAVYVIGARGYDTVAVGTNGFHCLIERWEIAVVTPICYDRVGAESTMRAVFHLERRRADGVADSVTLAEIERGYANGTFRVPAGPGVAYMLSPESPAPPHVMYYAPYASVRQVSRHSCAPLMGDGVAEPGGAKGLLPTPDSRSCAHRIAHRIWT